MEAQIANTRVINGEIYANLLRAGAFNLRQNMQVVNDLNVFPIPDGDTGSNMLMTIMGGVDAIENVDGSISHVARAAADGMLLSARGNSGVILSQIFDGIARGLEDMDEADALHVSAAMKRGVKHAYNAVLEPTEGTILTVARCATDYVDSKECETVEDLFEEYIHEAKKTLDRTPEMLPVLKKAGVVDSGGAGLLCIAEGAYHSILGDEEVKDMELTSPKEQTKQELDLDLFTSDSVLEFGYCTELLLRLQNSKTDVENFDVKIITDYLQGIGDSVVAFKTGSIVKIHVHTKTPDKVLSFCQQYGEFLTTKIENMSLQHNNITEEENFQENNTISDVEKKKYGIVAVCAGQGIKEMFMEVGTDLIVDGGQSMNPSTEDFINAFNKVPAENIIVLPNNSNVYLAAQQAAKMYEEANVYVIESKTIGDGYTAISMMNPDAATVEELLDDMTFAMDGVITAEIAPCIRDAEIDGKDVKEGDFIGVVGKDYIASERTRLDTAIKTIDGLDFANHDICIVIKGKNTPDSECKELENYISNNYKGKEVFAVDGMQDIYDYILILQ